MEFSVKMRYCGEIVNFSIFGFKSVKMAVTSPGMVSEVQKIGVTTEKA